MDAPFVVEVEQAALRQAPAFADDFVNERERHFGELPGQHLRRIAATIVMHNVVQPTRRPVRRISPVPSRHKKSGQGHRSLLLDLLSPICCFFAANVQRKERTRANGGSFPKKTEADDART